MTHMPMAQPMTQTPLDSRHPRRRRKVLALLSAGVVLGIGAVITLAVWNDPEFAQGTFTTQEFDIQGSVNGTTFSSSTSPTAPKTLAFSIEAADMTPGSTTYAPFAVQLSDKSAYRAAVTLQSVASTDLIGGLVYSLYGLDSWNEKCSAASPPPAETIILHDVPVNTTVPQAVFDLTATERPVHLCFAVTGEPTLVQGKSGTVTWQFTGTSGTPL